MSVSRMRMLIVASVAAMLLYGATGHGPHQIGADDGMTGAVVGLCLLLFTVLGYATHARAPTHAEPRRAQAVLAMPTRPVQIAIDRRARASPRALQQFRN